METWQLVSTLKFAVCSFKYKAWSLLAGGYAQHVFFHRLKSTTPKSFSGLSKPILLLYLPAMQGTRVWFLDQEDPLEKEMAMYSRILAWRIPWTEEPSRLQSLGSRESDTTDRLNHHHPSLSSHPLWWPSQASLFCHPGCHSGFLSWQRQSLH